VGWAPHKRHAPSHWLRGGDRLLTLRARSSGWGRARWALSYFPMTRQADAGYGAKARWRPLLRMRTRILRAAIAAMRPRGHGLDQPIDEDVLRDVERFLPHLPARLRMRLGSTLCLMEYGPLIYARRFTRFTRMTPVEGRRYLASWEHARGPRRRLLRSIRDLVFLCFYQHPQVLAALEVGWAERAATLRRLRAELLYERSAGDTRAS